MTKEDENKDIFDSIQEPYKITKAIFDGLYTKTTHFLLAGLGINPNSAIFRNFFVNSYIDDACVEQIIKNPIFILTKTKQFDASWKKLESVLKSLGRFVWEYDVGMDGENYLVMFVFEFPPVFAPDYFKFLEGKYSEFSSTYKRLFKKDIVNEKGTEVENTIYGVLYKTPALKRKIEELIGESVPLNGEFWNKMNPKREIYRYNN